jgi:4-alpha-glucanotransferase
LSFPRKLVCFWNKGLSASYEPPSNGAMQCIRIHALNTYALHCLRIRRCLACVLANRSMLVKTNKRMSTTKPGNVLPPGRQAGVCLHITSLPGPYGIGEIGQSAFEFVDAMREMKLAVWQFLPTGPTAYGDSPYQPLSTFAGNELLIDIRDLIKKGLLEKEEAQELAALPGDFVDYGVLIPIKNRLLRLAARRFEDQASPDLRTACDKFVEDNDALWLHDYALYRILKTRYGERPWPEWPPEYVHRDPDAIRALEESADAQIADIKVIQFLFFEQWGRLRRYANNRGIYLFGDMPIYIESRDPED